MLITTGSTIQNTENIKMREYIQRRRLSGHMFYNNSSNNNYFMELGVLNMKTDTGATRNNKNRCVKMVT